ncbi:histone lysine demethylase PHF8-like isoform X2 [Centruroides vittatus]|uniref:histone lysine demethylase PHF8-like isoform X2 n=1 Tax=Centruroides vittatus TaxID=120091 RepID=UPI003510B303
MSSVEVYCICGQPYDPSCFMIQCDVCKDWFHGSCVDIKEHESLDIEKYHCPQCQKLHGLPILKQRRNWHRHDFADPDAEGKAVQTGTSVFIRELKSRHFTSADDIVLKLRGQQLTLPYLIQNGFHCPIIVENKTGLGLSMPPDTFTVTDIMENIGADWCLDVIDVSRQDNIKMTMKEWVEYFHSTSRYKIYNVISLEFSNTRLSELVKPPTIVQKLSWVENFWPEMLPAGCPYIRPQVMKYCLMGVQDSFTDFHIDFGGSSVWYHVLRGEKVFYVIQPSSANLSLYEHWMSSSNQSETFFGDQVDACFKLVLKQGQTLFIPTGWIHAVLTTADSLVFGGNFIHSLNIPLQLQIYELERRIKTPDKYQFPSFETVHWFAAPQLLELLKNYNRNDRRGLQHLLSGVKSLTSALKLWSQEKERLEAIPQGIVPSKLIKDLSREVRLAEKHVSGKLKLEKDFKKTRYSPNKERRQLLENVILTEVKGNDENLQGMSLKSEDNMGYLPSVLTDDVSHLPLKFSLKSKLANPQDSVANSVSDTMNSSARFKLCISKNSVSYPISDSGESGSYMKLKYPKHDPLRSTLESQEAMLDKNSMLRLKVSHGKIIGGKDETVKNDSVYDFVDSDEDNLIVDEHPSNRRPKLSDLRKPSNNDASVVDYNKGQLKLRLSFNNKSGTDKLQSPQKSQQQVSDGGDTDSDIPKNGTIDDLLIASEIAVDTDTTRISLDDELSGGRTSPSTREAIQGMLFMSKSAFHFSNPAIPPNSTTNPSLDKEGSLASLVDSHPNNFSILSKKSPVASNKNLPGTQYSRFRRRFDEDDDFEESLKQCHQDGEFIYLGLEASDDEIHVFKPRGRTKRDEPWNPKARLLPNCPKPERPTREGVKKEAIESGLAAAAAKLADMPPLKRQYHRKRPMQMKMKDMDIQSGPSTSTFSQKRSLPANDLYKSKKPKKGLATAKQRLGKILKIHKMLY